MASSPITSWQINGEKMGKVTDLIFLGSKITADCDHSHEIKRCFAPWKKSFDQPKQHIKNQRHHLANKGPSSQSYDFSSSHVQRWELDHKEGWAQKNWCFWTVVLEETPESPLDSKEIKPVQSYRKSTLNIHWKYWCWSTNTLATWCEDVPGGYTQFREISRLSSTPQGQTWTLHTCPLYHLPAKSLQMIGTENVLFLYFLKIFLIFIYLVLPGLSCNIWI